MTKQVTERKEAVRIVDEAKIEIRRDEVSKVEQTTFFYVRAYGG